MLFFYLKAILLWNYLYFKEKQTICSKCLQLREVITNLSQCTVLITSYSIMLLVIHVAIPLDSTLKIVHVLEK